MPTSACTLVPPADDGGTGAPVVGRDGSLPVVIPRTRRRRCRRSSAITGVKVLVTVRARSYAESIACAASGTRNVYGRARDRCGGALPNDVDVILAFRRVRCESAPSGRGRTGRWRPPRSGYRRRQRHAVVVVRRCHRGEVTGDGQRGVTLEDGVGEGHDVARGGAPMEPSLPTSTPTHPPGDRVHERGLTVTRRVWCEASTTCRSRARRRVSAVTDGTWRLAKGRLRRLPSSTCRC